MNRFKAIGSAFLLVPALTLVSTQTRAEFKCGSPTVGIERTACEKAKEGPSPVDSLLIALGTCTAVDVVDILAKRRTPVATLTVDGTPLVRELFDVLSNGVEHGRRGGGR